MRAPEEDNNLRVGRGHGLLGPENSGNPTQILPHDAQEIRYTFAGAGPWIQAVCRILPGFVFWGLGRPTLGSALASAGFCSQADIEIQSTSFLRLDELRYSRLLGAGN
jgi:hypothetical protein